MALYRLVWDDKVGNSGPYRDSPSDGPWDYIMPAPPWPRSLLIGYDDVVVARHDPTVPQTKAARTYIRGGSRYTVDDSDPDYQILVDAGYTLVEVQP